MEIKNALSKVLAGACAFALTLSMSTSVFAAIGSNTSGVGSVGDDGMYSVDLVAEGYDPATVKSITFNFTADDSEGFGGGLMFNGSACGWDQKESNYWGNADQPVIASGADGSWSMTFDIPDGEFGEVAPEDYYAQICLQQWWGDPIVITSVTISDGGAAVLVETAAETEASSEEAPATVAKTADVAPTAGIVMVIAAAGLIIFALRKRNSL